MDLVVQQNTFQDHRELGREMELFMSLEVAPGSPVLLENGLVVFRQLGSLMADFLHEIGGFHEVRVPALAKTSLWEQSGHLAKFEESMFLVGDPESPLGLKPMNCPMHMLIFDATNRSYRDLPYRLHDQGILHRKENSGALHGLARLTQFHQDDSHIFLSSDQIEGEIQRCLEMIDGVYQSFGFSYRACLSTRPEKYLGDEAVWARSEAILEEALKSRRIEYAVDVGGGAFYGPKIGIEIRDSADRWWQVATVQVDFNLPERFDLNYIDSDGQPKRPVVIHLALYGAIERFMGIYLEHVQGNLPLKLAPQQVRIYPLADRHRAYASDVAKALSGSGIRAIIDDSNETLGAKLRNGRRFRAPFCVVVGDKEVAARSLAVKRRGNDQSEELSVDDFAALLRKENNFKIRVRS